MRKRVSACRRLLPGRARDFIRHFDEEVTAGDMVVLCCRVSRREQGRKCNLDGQEVGLREAVNDARATVLEVVRHIGSGEDPSWLAQAVALAREPGAKLLAESTDRFIRHPGYHSVEWHDAQARDPDLEWLRWWTAGVTLVTLLPPDATADQVRGYQSKRGQRAKGRAGGRPKQPRPGHKRERRERLLPVVLGLHRRGMSWRAIEAATGVPARTVQDWIVKYG